MAEASKLPPEVVSLVHHIELNKAGWWDSALRSLLLTAFWGRRELVAIEIDELQRTLRTDYNVTLTEIVIRKHLKRLIDAGKVLDLNDGRFKLEEGTIQECARQLDEAAELEKLVQERFSKCLDQFCPLLGFQEAWRAFSEEFLLPTVNQLGANTYRLITGSTVELDLPQLQSFIDCFPTEQPVNLRKFVREFLDPSEAAVRRYVLQAMNAYFAVRASGLDERTVSHWSARSV